MKLTINAPESHLQDMLDHVGLQLERGMTSGHVDAETFWDSSDKGHLTPEAIAEFMVAGIRFQHNAHIYSPEQLSALLMLAVKEARK